MKKLFSVLALVCLSVVAFAQPRIAESKSYKNLTVHVIEDGRATNGRPMVTLDETIKASLMDARETHTVGKVELRNRSSKPVFVQAGEIVAGGSQDRVLAVDTVLPPRSGWVPIKAFCVESGRWHPRNGGGEQFSAAPNYLPTTDLRLAAFVDRSQDAVWRAVTKYQAAIIAKTEGKEAAEQYLASARGSRSVTFTTSGITANGTLTLSNGGNLTWTTAGEGYTSAQVGTRLQRAPGDTITLSPVTGALGVVTLGNGSSTAGSLAFWASSGTGHASVGDTYHGTSGLPARRWLSAAGSSLHLTLELSPIKGETAEYLRAFSGLLTKYPKVVGFAFEIHGQPVWLELYGKPRLAHAQFKKLLRAATAEAVVTEKESFDGAAVAFKLPNGTRRLHETFIAN
jgi:hypothetical protein